MSTTIEVNDLQLYAYHGVDEQERAVGNDFSVTVHLDLDFEHAIYADTLAGTVSYTDIIDVIRAEMGVASQLLEHVAGRIRTALVNRYPTITGGLVRVCKLTPPCGPVRLASACAVIRW